jgi:hypothetical protein
MDMISKTKGIAGNKKNQGEFQRIIRGKDLIFHSTTPGVTGSNPVPQTR